ncbi:hypothetical protein [Nocardioides sp. 1609]|uniref:hypothetical protein n=1 Tax=Nocardioides sp. 1609 TaxID=2508327 RepID=UPI00106F2792|nr:hypothetical protein [Nocardioides sp. 1609]
MPTTVRTRRPWVHLAFLAVAAVLATLVVSGGAYAETETVRDEKGKALQTAPYQLLRGTLSYTDTRTVLTARIERVSKKKTWVGGSIYYPGDGGYLKMFTTYRRGVQVARAYYSSSDEPARAIPITARWDVKRDRVTLILDNTLNDPKPGNRRATLDLYTVTKGWNHGPHCGIKNNGQVKRCNDDYVAARLRR